MTSKYFTAAFFVAQTFASQIDANVDNESYFTGKDNLATPEISEHAENFDFDQSFLTDE